MAIRLEDKQQIVSEVSEAAKSALSAVVADYRGVTVTDLTSLRKAARNNGVYLRVVRNTLAKRAVAGTEFECLAQGANAEKAKEAGADIVGFDDLAASIKGGNTDFDVVIASPDAMRIVGQLGTILGPKGLMPNPKVGTVTPDVAGAVRNAKAGQIRFRTDKNGIIHGGIGKVGFNAEAIRGNLEALLADLKKAKPSTSKGVYVQKVVLSSTMGPGVQVDASTLNF